jgi:hypothetical protein
MLAKIIKINIFVMYLEITQFFFIINKIKSNVVSIRLYLNGFGGNKAT